MSPALFFTVFSLSLGLATLVGSRQNNVPVGSPWVAAVVTALALGGLVWSEALGWAATGCATLGLLGPAAVMARVRGLVGRGEYRRAARLLRRLLQVRRSPALQAWARVWEATDAQVHGDAAPADRQLDQWVDTPEFRAQREWLLGICWRWEDALASRTPDLRIRARCEVGDLEGAVAECAEHLKRRGGPREISRRRLEWLAPVAFSGRESATQVLCSLLRVPPALAGIWQAVALSASGQPDAAHAALETLRRRPDLSDGLRYILDKRSAHLPTRPTLGAVAQDLLVRVEREILAGSVLRLRLPRQAPRTVGLLAALLLVFGVQAWRGGTTDAATALELGALLPDHGFPEQPARLLSYAFLHHGALHLLVNGFTIALIGATVEAALGGWRLLAIFVGSALGAGLAISYLGGQEITLGASGAAMGLLGALGVIAARDRRTRGTRTGRQIGIAIAALVVVQSGLDAAMPEISFAGHLGGACSGAALALLLVRGSGAGTLHRE